MDKKIQKLGKNVLLLTIGNFASKILSFLLVPIYTAVLTTEEYGTADLFTTSANLVLPIFTLLIYESVMRFALDKTEDKSQVFSIGLWITLGGSVVVLIGTQLLYGIESIKLDDLFLFTLYFTSTALYNVVLQFVKGIEEVSIYSVAGVINTFIYIVSNILFLVVVKMGVTGYILSFIIGHIVSTGYAFFGAKLYRYIVSWKRIQIQKVKEMVVYALPMIPNSISWWVSNSSDKFILTFFWGTSINGIYSVAYKIPSILSIFLSIFIGAWQISAVEQFGTSESQRFYSNVYEMYETLLVVGSSVLIAITRVLASVLYSADFYQAWLYTPILILASVFNSLAAFYGSIYTSSKNTGMLFYSTLLGAVSNIVLNFILIPKWGAMGAAIATMVSYFIVWFIRIINSRRIMVIVSNHKRSFVSYTLLVIEIILLCFNTIELYPGILLCSVFIFILYRNNLRLIIETILGRVVSKYKYK